MSYRFERLEIWKQARGYCNNIYNVTREFPKEEKFAMTDQLKRAALSVVFNVAEGSERNYDKEFIRFLRISQASICEIVTALYIALDQKYINQNEFEKNYKESNELSARINAMIRTVSSKLDNAVSSKR